MELDSFLDPDPYQIVKLVWPDIVLYNKQVEILYSFFNNDETLVPAGNMLGKDYITGLAALVFFLSRTPCRVVTTSVDEGQLEKVLWGEISNFIATAKYDLTRVLIPKHLNITKRVKGVKDPKSYLIGRVAAKEEGLLGHHLARGIAGQKRTAMIYDEGSGIPHEFKEKTDTWAQTTLVIGNCFPCENFFKYGVQQGPKPYPSVYVGHQPKVKPMIREVIKIKATDSPNVRYALAELEAGKTPSNKILIPGVLSYQDYIKRLETWDEQQICVSLNAEFYEGAEIMMFPPKWIDQCERVFKQWVKPTKGKAMGVDSAEGGDDTCWAIGDEHGLIDLISKKTADTSVITGETIALMRKWRIDPRNVMFDSGGGGKEHVDRLRRNGFAVRATSFSESPLPETAWKKSKSKQEKTDDKEVRFLYKNRRSEMYMMLRRLIDPDTARHGGWAIDPKYTELRRQLTRMPLLYDGEGKIYLPPKNALKRRNEKSGQKPLTLREILGRSPDQADAVALMVFAMLSKVRVGKAGAA